MDVAKIQAALNQDNLSIINGNLINRSAVLVPLIRNSAGEWSILFEVRASHLKRQPGEICFPGGKLDGMGESPCEAARRETGEELGIKLDQIDVWGQLGLIISPYNLLLYSFVGEIPDMEALNPSPNEVDSIFAVDLKRLLALDPEIHNVRVHVKPSNDFPFEKIPGGRDYPWRAGILPEVFYEVDGYIIWGLTARILQHFLNLIREIK